MSNSPPCAVAAYLCVDNGSHPEALGGPGHRQHGPEEDENGQDEREQRSRDNVVEDDDKVAQHLRLGHHGVIEGRQQLQWPRQPHKKLIGLFNLVVFKHATESTEGGEEKSESILIMSRSRSDIKMHSAFLRVLTC